MITICVNSLFHISNTRNGKYEWMQVDTIYNIITNVPLFHILHIRNSDICGMKHEITRRRLSAITTVITHGLNSTANR